MEIMCGKIIERIATSTLLVILFNPIVLELAQADDSFIPIYHPVLEVRALTGEIKIDGDLSDSGWRNAASADNFAEHNPGDQTKPPVESRAYIAYDGQKLYIAMVCHDDPSLIRASYCERDGGIGSDDNICLLIDTYGDASWAYELNVNPLGIQADAIWSKNGGEDATYDLTWESAGKITDSGYQIEAAVPFSSLRFPNKNEQIWKVDFWRNHPRELRRQYSWAAYDRNDQCWPCQWGTVTGIRNVKSGKGIEILPTLFGYKTGKLSGSGTPGAPYDFVNDKAEGEFSLGGKYAASSNITIEATYNPDYSQVEADPDQIDINSNFDLYLNEKRPFFQEGSDLFRTNFNVVYTRSINNPEFAAKATARMDRTSIAYLLARDETTPIVLPFEEYNETIRAGKSTSNIIRARRTIGEDSHVGMLITDRRIDGGGAGTILSSDLGLRLSKSCQFIFQAIATRSVEVDDDYLNSEFNWRDTIVVDSDTTYREITFDNNEHTTRFDGEKFWGHAAFVVLVRETANSYAELSYLERSPTFRADNGFQPVNNMRSLQSYTYHQFRFDKGLFEKITPTLLMRYKKNFAGEVKEKVAELGLEGSLRVAQINFHALYSRNTEKYKGEDYDNIWKLHNCFSIYPGAIVAFGGSINYGHQIARDERVIGKETSVSAWTNLKPMPRLLVSNTYNYIKSTNLNSGKSLFEGYIFRTSLNYQISKELTIRLIGQYNDFCKSWNLDPLLTYRLNPFSIFYIGATIDYADCDTFADDSDDATVIGTSTRMNSRQYFMKLQYLFQL
jgi:hypothetical protein